jgi:hypothetical protein
MYWSACLPSTYEGDMLWWVSHIIHTAEAKQTLALLLNREGKAFLLYFSRFTSSCLVVHYSQTRAFATSWESFLVFWAWG